LTFGRFFFRASYAAVEAKRPVTARVWARLDPCSLTASLWEASLEVAARVTSVSAATAPARTRTAVVILMTLCESFSSRVNFGMGVLTPGRVTGVHLLSREVRA
jgi:hypothetical protein